MLIEQHDMRKGATESESSQSESVSNRGESESSQSDTLDDKPAEIQNGVQLK